MNRPDTRHPRAAGGAPAPRILVVDDEPLVRQALGRALALERYETLARSRRPQALDLLAAERTMTRSCST